MESGVQNLKISDIAKAFSVKELTHQIEFASMPEGLKSIDGWELFWRTIDDLWTRSPINDRNQNKQLLQKISIAFGTDGNLWPPNELFFANQDSKDLFSRISPVIWYQSKSNNASFFSELVPHFSLVNGLDLLKAAEESLPDLWERELFSPRGMVEWFDNHRLEINPYLVNKIRNLSIWPTAEGELKPLSELFLTGDFDDPLNLARLVDLEELGGERDFLERHLNVTRLDFITYVRDWVPSVIHQRELILKEKFSLVRILAENLGRLRDHQDIRSILEHLPIVWCGGEEFHPATNVWFDSKKYEMFWDQKLSWQACLSNSQNQLESFISGLVFLLSQNQMTSLIGLRRLSKKLQSSKRTAYWKANRLYRIKMDFLGG